MARRSRGLQPDDGGLAWRVIPERGFMLRGPATPLRYFSTLAQKSPRPDLCLDPARKSFISDWSKVRGRVTVRSKRLYIAFEAPAKELIPVTKIVTGTHSRFIR